MSYSLASIFFAKHGPIKSVLYSGQYDFLTNLSIMTIGEATSMICSLSSGYLNSIIFTIVGQLGQIYLLSGFSFKILSYSILISFAAYVSSTIFSTPIFFKSMIICGYAKSTGKLGASNTTIFSLHSALSMRFWSSGVRDMKLD